MNRLKFASILLCATLATKVSASERLIYAVTHNGTTNEVFAISPDDAQPSRIFSDESSPIALAFMPRSGTSAYADTAVLGNRMFTAGRERSSSGGKATGIFEFALGGPAQPRKILDLPANERVDLLAITDDGAKLAYLSLSGTGLTLFVHDLRTGNLLHKIDMLKIAGGCNVRNIGWLPDHSTLFFTLDEGAEGFMSDDDYKQIGTWLVHDDGTSLIHLPTTLGALREPGYRVTSGLSPIMLGVVNGRYLFQVFLQNISGAPQLTGGLALADSHSGTNTKIDLQGKGVSQYLLSHGGRYIAYVQQDASKFVGSNHIVPPAHLWVRPLAAGGPKELLSIETGVEKRTSLTLIGWTSE